MAPSKSKVREPAEDISQLRKPITLHGKPIEQILNSIHYGSHELRNLLLHECDMIFECKVCRALFRDLPNFISHKRRYCSKSAAEINHFAIGETPEERVVIVQPKAVDELEIAGAQSSSSCHNLEDTLQRIRTGEIGNSYAFQVYTNAAAKLRHQKDHARITSLRPREIPTNSNAVFVDVKTTSVNIHDRVKTSDTESNTAQGHSSRRKVGPGKKRVNCYNYSNTDEKQLRSSRTSVSNVKVNNKKPDELSDRLIKELKVIQNKVKNRNQESQKPQQERVKGPQLQLAKENSHFTWSKQKVNTIDSVEVKRRDTAPCSSVKLCKDRELIRSARQNLPEIVSDQEESANSSSSSSNASSDNEEEDTASKNHEEMAGKSKRSLICPKCGGIFSSRKSLQFHIKTNHAVKRMFYPCPSCSNVYYYFNAVTRHLQRNHNKTNEEIDEMRQMLRSKAFSKPSPSQDSASRVVKRGMIGTRRSLRYKDAFKNKKLGNAPFVFSSLNKGKKLSAKKDPVLSEKDVKTENIIPKEEIVTTEMSKVVGAEDINSKQIRTFQPSARHEKSENSNRTACVSDSKKWKQAGSSKLFNDIGMQMQTCNKCSRLFGRKSTYEKHIAACGVQSDLESGNENERRNGKDERISKSDNPSISTRKKNKDPQLVSNVSTVPVLHNDFDLVNSRSRRSKGESDGGNGCQTSFMTGLTSATQLNSMPQDFKIALSPCKSDSPVKVKEKVDSNGLKTDGMNFNIVKNGQSFALNFQNFLKDEKKEISDDATTSNLNHEFSNTVTRLKSRGCSNVMEVNVTGNCDKSVDKIIDDVGGNVKLQIQERPRRKRKVPSRNIEAVEMLQKIHRSDESESVTEKWMKYSLVDDDDCSRRNTSLKHRRDARVIQKSNGQIENEDSVVSKTKRRSSKIFVSNNNKLECYNLSKVEKFMDTKRFKCLKCRTRYGSKASLKLHVVRTHLRWSRFQCKLCSFSCFHRSECCTHITRRHLKGNEPDRNRSINSLVIDLSKKGSEVMALKKHETIKAKSQQQLQDKEDSLYKNQNARKNPRLPEKKLDYDNSSNISQRKQHIENKKDAISSSVKREKVSPSSSSSESHSEKDKMLQSRRVVQISHLVPRKPRLPPSTPQITVTAINNPHANFINTSEEKRRSSNLSLPYSSSEKSDDEGASTRNATSLVNGNSPSNCTSVKRAALPFNISTRKSPRVFDTSPYNREEAATTEETKTATLPTNEVIMRTRHSAYTKTLPIVSLSAEPSKSSFDSKDCFKDKDCVNSDTGSQNESHDSEEELLVLGSDVSDKDELESKSEGDDLGVESEREDSLSGEIKTLDDIVSKSAVSAQHDEEIDSENDLSGDVAEMGLDSNEDKHGPSSSSLHSD